MLDNDECRIALGSVGLNRDGYTFTGRAKPPLEPLKGNRGCRCHQHYTEQRTSLLKNNTFYRLEAAGSSQSIRDGEGAPSSCMPPLSKEETNNDSTECKFTEFLSCSEKLEEYNSMPFVPAEQAERGTLHKCTCSFLCGSKRMSRDELLAVSQTAFQYYDSLVLHAQEALRRRKSIELRQPLGNLSVNLSANDQEFQGKKSERRLEPVAFHRDPANAVLHASSEPLPSVMVERPSVVSSTHSSVVSLSSCPDQGKESQQIYAEKHFYQLEKNPPSEIYQQKRMSSVPSPYSARLAETRTENQQGHMASFQLPPPPPSVAAPSTGSSFVISLDRLDALQVVQRAAIVSKWASGLMELAKQSSLEKPMMAEKKQYQAEKSRGNDAQNLQRKTSTRSSSCSQQLPRATSSYSHLDSPGVAIGKDKFVGAVFRSIIGYEDCEEKSLVQSSAAPSTAYSLSFFSPFCSAVDNQQKTSRSFHSQLLLATIDFTLRVYPSATCPYPLEKGDTVIRIEGKTVAHLSEIEAWEATVLHLMEKSRSEDGKRETSALDHQYIIVARTRKRSYSSHEDAFSLCPSHDGVERLPVHLHVQVPPPSVACDSRSFSGTHNSLQKSRGDDGYGC